MSPGGRLSPGGGSVLRSLLLGSTSQVAGRLLLSLIRLGAAMLILRLLGAEQFGAYVLLLTVLTLPEWLVDFGQTDIAIREISRHPRSSEQVLAALLRLRLIQSLILAPLLPAGLVIAGYPLDVVIAGALGSASLPALALALVARTRLRAGMHMSRDMLAELASGAVLLPATAIACFAEAGIIGLMAAYLASRLAWLAAAAVLARGTRAAPRDDAAGAGAPAPVDSPLGLLRGSLPLGAIGLLVGVYDGVAPMVLGAIGDLNQVAVYWVATRCAFPALLVVHAMGIAFFPLLARAWSANRKLLATLQHMAFDAALFLAIGFVCGLVGAAEFIMAAFDPGGGEAGLIEQATVLRVMALVVVARTVSTAMAPLIVVAGWQSRAAWLTVVSLTAQLLGLFATVPVYGALGATLTCLLVELLTSVLGIGWLARRATGVALAWNVPLRLLASGAIACAAVLMSPLFGSLAGGLVAGTAFVILAVASRAIAPHRLRSFAAALASRPGAANRTAST